jgi:hypothetical protein
VERSLAVIDNGTGMTQEIIENNLLRVGASRYQEAKFQEKHLDFRSISRFGIGILATFMVSDEVEIVTVHPDEEKARRLLLRSVHGRYLVRLLDKNDPDVPTVARRHGTSVRLILRPTASLADVVRLARQWIYFPKCQVTVHINDDPPIAIGFASPKQALEAAISDHTIIRDSESRIEVREQSMDGIDLAYLVEWDRYYHEWRFVLHPLTPAASYFEADAVLRLTDNDAATSLPCGICVEGIMVDAASPGYKGLGVIALANLSGKGAPRTNVARSSLEDTREYREACRKIYELYMMHEKGEMIGLESERSYSLTWAATEARYLLSPLVIEIAEQAPVYPEEFRKVREALPSIVLETEDGRIRAGLNELQRAGAFWTTDCDLYSSFEYLLRSAPVNGTIGGSHEHCSFRRMRCPGARSCVLGTHMNCDEREPFRVLSHVPL